MASDYLNLTPEFVRLYPLEAEQARQAALREWLLDMVAEDRAECAPLPPELAGPIVPWWRR